ncbi:MAG: hypothetical protein JXL97_11590 [Bacteroidales bacterium]|nr:hypothetical protein [Bacteroidales bacterium]
MALPIKSIPVLSGQVAKDFQKKIDENLKNSHSVDFSKQRKMMKEILKRSNLK